MAKPTYTSLDLYPKVTPRGLELAPVTAQALLSHACQDATRVALMGVGLDASRGAAWLCATDGHRLIRIPIRGEIPSGVKPRCMWVEREVRSALDRMKAGDVVGVGDGGAPMLVLPWIDSPYDFVPTDQVMPSAKLGTTRQHFNPEYLADAMKVGESFQRAIKTSASVTFATVGTSELDPVRADVVVGGAIVAQIVVMPMRDVSGSLPSWHGANGTKVGEVTTEPTAKRAPKSKSAKREANVDAKVAA